MPYIIDGHNLIPNIQGIQLSAIDDELQLISLLQEFCRTQRRRIEVYFDNAPLQSAGRQSFGCVTAVFVRQGLTADAAIASRLRTLHNKSANWTVVSSDRQVQAEARQNRAQVISSQDFSQQIEKALRQKETSSEIPEPAMSDDELREWLHLFDADENA